LHYPCKNTKWRSTKKGSLTSKYTGSFTTRAGPREKEETTDRIWMCNFEEKKSSLKDI
jgi:hypothetical protein